MTKKILAGILSFAMVLSLAACGESGDTSNDVSATEGSSVAEDVKNDSETENSSETETSEAGTGYEVTYIHTGEEITCERPSIFENNWRYSTYKALHQYEQVDNGDMCFYVIDQINEWNNLDNKSDINPDDPNSWFDTIKDTFAEDIQSGTNRNSFFSDGDFVLNSQEQVEVNGRTFVKFDLTVHPHTEASETDKDLTALGYLTFIKSENIEGYENGDLAGFMITDFADTADKTLIEEYLQHAVETFSVPEK